MAKEANLNKALYKIQLYLLKVIPMVMAFICLLNTTLSYFDIDLPVLSYISSNSILTIIFFYISSYVFKFCEYHRMFIHYSTLMWILNVYDMYIGVPISDRSIFSIYLIITGIFIFIILYLYVKSHRKTTKRYSRQN